MKALVTKHIPDWRDRLIMAAIFAVFGWMIGSIPQVYYQFFDSRQYVTIEQPIVFDKKLYGKCETLKAIIRGKSIISSDTKVTYSLMKVEESGAFKEVKYFERDGFVTESKDIQVRSSSYALDCKVDSGVYFFRGILQYWVRGTSRTYPFTSDLFTVVETDYIDEVKSELNP